MQRTPWSLALGLLAAAASLGSLSLTASASSDEPPRIREVHRVRLESIGRGYLGVTLQSLTPELREHFGAPKSGGVLIASVEEDSPAGTAGVRVGDVLVRVGTEEVTTPWDVRHAVGEAAGETVVLELRRDGVRLELDATLEKREGPRAYFLPRDGHCCGPLGLHGVRESLEAIDWEELGERIDGELEAIPWEDISDEVAESIRSALRVAPRIHLHGEDADEELEKRLEELEKRLEELTRRLENP